MLIVDCCLLIVEWWDWWAIGEEDDWGGFELIDVVHYWIVGAGIDKYAGSMFSHFVRQLGQMKFQDFFAGR